MGQRLNLEITDGDNVLASAYYHWSGYTSSSLNLTNIIMTAIKEESNNTNEKDNNIKNMNDKIEAITKELNDDVLKACKLLRLTGAALTEDQIEYINKNCDDSYKELYKDDDIVDRNNGLIAITEKEMANTRIWEEARVTIDITNKVINFNSIYVEPMAHYLEDYSVNINDLPTTDIDYSNISFDDFEKFSNELYELLKNASGVRYNGLVFVFIE